jgi:hypothetical protein
MDVMKMSKKKSYFNVGDLVNVIPKVIYDDPDNFSYELKSAVEAGVTFRIRHIDELDGQQEIYVINNDDGNEIDECVYANEIRPIRREWDA